MDDDKTDTAGAAPEGGARKRPPPTIDLEASDVSDNSSATTADVDNTAAETNTTTPPPTGESATQKSRLSPVLVSAATGALAAALILGASWVADWPPPHVAAVPQTADLAPSKSEVDALGARVAKIESNASKPATATVDSAISARLDALEKSIASLRADMAAARGQSEKAIAAVGEIKSAPPAAVAAPDMAAIEERLGKIEQATIALTAGAAAPQPAPQPVEDPRLRQVAAATLLDTSVHQGEPYAAALTAAKAFAADAKTLAPLDAFAATGIPSARALGRELLALLPKLAPKPEAAAAPSGMWERLQQGASKLVRIQRTDARAGADGVVIARAAAAAQHDDVVEAKRELNSLAVADRAPVQAWIEKVNARDAALAASRQFVADTMTALSKSAR